MSAYKTAILSGGLLCRPFSPSPKRKRPPNFWWPKLEETTAFLTQGGGYNPNKMTATGALIHIKTPQGALLKVTGVMRRTHCY